VKGRDKVEVTREQIGADLQKICNEIMGDWEYSGEITLETRLFADLGLESIDVVALGAAIEEHYRRNFPFAQWLTQLREQRVDDIHVKDVIEFLHDNLKSSSVGESQ
jgi:acyl carrier protein